MRWTSPFMALALLSPSAALADPASPYGINTHVPSTAALNRVSEAGIGWIRVDFNWLQIEPTRDGYQWATTDRVVSDARARGLEIYATLAYTPGWANGGQGGNVPATNPAEWADFVQDTVSRYKGSIHAWGLWNEPNLEQFFTGDVDAYIDDVLRPGALAAKAADPSCAIVGPELASIGSWQRWMYVILDEAGDSIDVISHHAYEDTGSEVIRTMGGWVPFWERPQVVGILEATGQDQKPLWLTETGWHTDEVSEDAQARYLEQVLTGMQENSWLDKVFFYELVDDPNITEKWGILSSDLNPKPSFYTYQGFIFGG